MAWHSTGRPSRLGLRWAVAPPTTSIHFSEAVEDDIADMAALIGQSRGEVVRQALSVYRALTREAARGSLILVERPGAEAFEAEFPYFDALVGREETR